ncbi:MAG: DUF1553 domain-containing protein, partial [Planctomycetota bacterium]
TSETYRCASDHPDPDRLAEKDAGCQSYATFRPRRLSAEELRDAMLAVSGELNTAMGGPPIRPEIHPEAATQPRHIMGSVAPAYQPSPTAAERHRRTIYAERIRTLRDPLLEVFNQPGPDASCEVRESSTVTPQAFTLLNSRNSQMRAVALARRLEEFSDNRSEQVSAAFLLLYGRHATAEEIELSVEHVVQMSQTHRQSPAQRYQPPTYVVREMVEEMTGLKFYWVEDLDVYRDSFQADPQMADLAPDTCGLAELCLVLLNSNEFVYVY